MSEIRGVPEDRGREELRDERDEPHESHELHGTGDESATSDDGLEGAGALPLLSEESNQRVLGAPSIKVKTKTNATKVFVLVAVVVGLLFVGSGVVFFFKHRAQGIPLLSRADEKLDRSKVKNKAVESPSIDKQKADIKKKDEDEKTQAQIEAAKAQARAAAMAKASGQPPVAGAVGAPGSTGGAAGSASGAASAPRPPTREEMMLAGEVFAGPLAGRASTSVAQATEKAADTPADAAHGPLALFSEGGARQSGEGAPAGSSTPKPDSLEARLRPSVLESAKAGRLGNLDYLLKRGTTIPCALKGGIDTTLPGFVSCSVINDVYSANGATLLVERGATVFGEQKASVAQGQARVFVLWTRLDNPSGVFAELDSPGADQMGNGGLPGFVDDHFWTRFGGAIMLSLIQDSFATLQARVGNNGNGSSVQVSNTTGSAQSMPSEALKSTINIPPTIVVPPASIVTVMVARDVSFEAVYKVVK